MSQLNGVTHPDASTFPENLMIEEEYSDFGAVVEIENDSVEDCNDPDAVDSTEMSPTEMSSPNGYTITDVEMSSSVVSPGSAAAGENSCNSAARRRSDLTQDPNEADSSGSTVEWLIQPDFSVTNVSSVVRDNKKRDVKQGAVPVLSGIVAVYQNSSNFKTSMKVKKDSTQDSNKPAASDSSGKVNLPLKVSKSQISKPKCSFDVRRKVVISSSKSSLYQKNTGRAVENDKIQIKTEENVAQASVSCQLTPSIKRFYSLQTAANCRGASQMCVNELSSQAPASALAELTNNSSRSITSDSKGLQPSKMHQTHAHTQLVAVPIVSGNSLANDSSKKSPMVIVVRKKAKSLTHQENSKSTEDIGVEEKVVKCEKTIAIHYPRKQSLKPVVKEWFPCSECPARFRFGPTLAEHAVKHHRTFLCTECDINFELQSDLQIHVKTHSARKLHACRSCDFKSKTESGLRTHAKIHVTGKPFSCGRCFAEFNKSLNFHRHILGHKTEKLYKCDNCTANFTSKNGIQAHMVIHLNENPFRCTICPAKFKRAGSLKKHLMRSHVCSYCTAKFKRKVKLKEHLATHKNLPAEQTVTTDAISSK